MMQSFFLKLIWNSLEKHPNVDDLNLGSLSSFSSLCTVTQWAKWAQRVAGEEPSVGDFGKADKTPVAATAGPVKYQAAQVLSFSLFAKCIRETSGASSLTWNSCRTTGKMRNKANSASLVWFWTCWPISFAFYAVQKLFSKSSLLPLKPLKHRGWHTLQMSDIWY